MIYKHLLTWWNELNEGPGSKAQEGGISVWYLGSLSPFSKRLSSFSAPHLFHFPATSTPVLEFLSLCFLYATHVFLLPSKPAFSCPATFHPLSSSTCSRFCRIPEGHTGGAHKAYSWLSAQTVVDDSWSYSWDLACAQVQFVERFISPTPGLMIDYQFLIYWEASGSWRSIVKTQLRPER